MKKKTTKIVKDKTRLPRTALKLHYVVIFFGLLVLVFGSVKMYEKPHVLGASVFLARGGDDSGSSGGGDDSGSGGSVGGTSSGSGGSGSGSGSSGGSGGSGSVQSGSGGSGGSVSQGAVSNDTKVDCVGPDGRHFTTDFKDCSALNNAWHRPNFSFTPLSHTTTEVENETPHPTGAAGENEQEAEVKKMKPTNIRVKVEDGKQEIRIEDNGTKVELRLDGDKVVVKAKTEDGKETELESHDALEKINEVLADDDVEVGTDEAKGLIIKKGEVEAHTQLPISVDPTTNALTVTTPAGTKTVAILPDEAVQHILGARILTNIQNTSQTSPTGETTTSQNITLTTQGNEAVFEVNGTANKKALGLLPLSFAKQVIVSAETGKVLQTNETLFNRLLEALSF